MGPKGKIKGDLDDIAWRKAIEETPLEEDTFHVKTILVDIVESEFGQSYLKNFEDFASEGKRYVIRNIAKPETMFMINQLGAAKKSTDESFVIFEKAYSFLQNKEDIPADIMALLIKHLMLKIKAEYFLVASAKLGVLEGLHQESKIMLQKDEVKGTVANARPIPIPESPPPKSDKKQKDQLKTQTPILEEGKKYNTNLRERGEEWRDRICADDYPLNGPDIYVLITGFLDPKLPMELIKIGVLINAVIQIRINIEQIQGVSHLGVVNKRLLSETEIINEKALKYWDDIQDFRLRPVTAEYLKDTAFIMFNPPYWDYETLSNSAEKIYDELSYLAYDVQDLSRQHLHYLDKMNLVFIPEEDIAERYYSYYCDNINDIPLECVTVYSLLDSVLATVCNIDLPEFSSSASMDRIKSYGYHKKKSIFESRESAQTVRAKSTLKSIFNTLHKTPNDNKRYRLTHGEEYEMNCEPIVIKYGDFVKKTTFHLKNINLDNIVRTVLLGMPLHKLWLSQNRPTEENDAKISFHINALLSCFERDDIETAELTRLLHLLACRKIYNNRSSLKVKHTKPMELKTFKKVYLKRSVLSEPVKKPDFQGTRTPSFPSIVKSMCVEDMFEEEERGPESSSSFDINTFFQCHDISELISASEIANNQPMDHMIEDFEFFEDFYGNCASQILLDAFNNFNCVDYRYCEVTDSIVMMFFNSHNNEGIYRQEWRSHIPTPLCLQDFFDFILDEHYDWLQNEERIYDAEMLAKTLTQYQQAVDNFGIISCIQDSDVAEDLFIEGSLKHTELCEALEDEFSEENHLKTDSTVATNEKYTNKFSSTKSSAKVTGSSSSNILPEHKKSFLGYDISDRRVEVFGKDSVYFSEDGTRIATFYTIWIPYNIEFAALNIVPGGKNVEFWIYKSLSIPEHSEISADAVSKRCDSFRIDTEDHVMINMYKQEFNVPIINSTEKLSTVQATQQTNIKHSSMHNLKGKKENLNFVEEITPTSEPQIETKNYYSFSITWPNGLIVESVYTENSPDISHIKQYYVGSLEDHDEDFRCFSSNGEVLIFKHSGDIVVLSPEGRCVFITNCEKKVITQPEDQQEIGDDGSKKKKKEKNKTKDSKPEPEPEAPEKPVEYELIINEFEVIENSGLWQKWVDDCPYDLETLLITKATDFNLGEIFCKRNDGTTFLINYNGVQTVTFSDQTKILTFCEEEEEEIFPEWTEQEKEYLDIIGALNVNKSADTISQKSYDSTASSRIEDEKIMGRTDGYISVQIKYAIEHPNFARVTIDKMYGRISIDSPNKTTLTVDQNNHYMLSLSETIKADFDGENLHIVYEACPGCRSSTICDVEIFKNPVPKEASDEKIQANPKQPNGSPISPLKGKKATPKPEPVASPPVRYWAKVKDSFCKKIVVEMGGEIVTDDACSSDFVANDDQIVKEERNANREKENIKTKINENWRTESYIEVHRECKAKYKAKDVRFLVMHPDLSCSEVIHRALLDDYKKECRWKPWCLMRQYETFKDHRSLHSVLMPIPITETEKWMMESKLATKPVNLYYKDLQNVSGSCDKPKGFYKWMRPYKRFHPEPIATLSVHTHKQPKAFVLRILEQQWHDHEREELKGGKELLHAILRYRRFMASEVETRVQVPLVSMWIDDNYTFYLTQALAKRIFNELKDRLEEDMLSTPKKLTTSAPPAPCHLEEMEGETEEFDLDKYMYDEREKELRELEKINLHNERVAKFWRVHEQTLKEEEFYMYLFRDGTVPKYFYNLLGGAIWWELYNLTDQAVTKARRFKLKCVCESDGNSSRKDPSASAEKK